ncbi:MAG: 2-C-methyl-D-erythritol 2,4-cyclodiphosphate synthase [Verrucomicrobia bacterium]|nr:MAG: 2-C-methyl-D-erythritol 2,4-cyclodiphosphate synthase [Verrucomicrobiota bacterium]
MSDGMFVGIGYDVHRFAGNNPLILGGVHLEFPLGLEGHSDADVLTHALADALLGAAGQPDIGHFFPNTDSSLRGISSLEILQRVVGILQSAGFKVHNVDCTVIAEQPKISPHLDAMKKALAGAIWMDPTRIGIKATTNEKLGFLGRGEGIAAFAVASLVKAHSEKL